MAAFEQPRAGGHNQFSVIGDTRGTTVITSKSGRALPASVQWVGSIAGGLAVGAAAAMLVGGLMGIHETSTSIVTVGHSAVSTTSTRAGNP